MPVETDDVVLAVDGLSVSVGTPAGPVDVVHDVAFELRRGETLGLVGESGSGKSLTCLALLGLAPQPGGRITSGSVRLLGEDVLTAGRRRLEDLRGHHIGMIFQDPVGSLNPAYTVGDQIAETLRRHKGVSRRESVRAAVAALGRVGIPDPARRAHAYPHEFSGGMCQRVMIAMAIVCEPEVLVVDEATTALDVTTQAQILALLHEMGSELGVSMVFVSHDLGVIGDIADRVLVMYGGQVVEEASVDPLFRRPRHPYTASLLASATGSAVGTPASIPVEAPGSGGGCRFVDRCPHVAERCRSAEVDLVAVADGRRARCLRHAELHLEGVS